MKNVIYFLLILLSFKGISQTTMADNTFEFDFKKAIKNSRHFETHTSSYFVQANKNQKKIQLRFKIKSVTKKKEGSIKDSFLDFKIDGYSDVDNCINFGTKRKPRNKSIYFNHKKLKSNTVDVYFIVPKDFENGKIYYGNELLADFKVK